MSNAKKKLSADQILAKLAEIRSQIPILPPVRAANLPADPAPPSGAPESLSDFELESIAMAAETMANELRTAIDEANAKLIAQALEAYYVAEELARDPAHADLIPHVEAMRAAYEKDFGKPIPPRGQRS